MAKKPQESDSVEDSSGSASGGASDSSGSASGSGSESGSASKPEGAPKSGKTASPGGGKSQRGRPANRAAAAAVATPRGSGHQLIPVICSECYEEFVFDSGVPAKTLTCPVCEHQAARPDDALLHKINDVRSQEKLALSLSLVLTVLGVVLMAAWVVTTRNPHNQEGGTFWLTLGGGLVMFVAAGGLAAAKYESHRHEVYF